MTTSPETVKAIAGFEADRLTPYNDLSDNATEGVGHLMHKGPLVPGEEHPETRAKALADFADDLKNKAEKYIPVFVKVTLNQNQFDALSSFCFNLGPGLLKKLVSETGLNEGDYAAVGPEILEYNKARVKGILVVVAGLTRRRLWEAGLWNKVSNEGVNENPSNG
jgi:lysozyme